MRLEQSPLYRRIGAVLLSSFVIASCSKRPEESSATFKSNERSSPSAVAASDPNRRLWDPVSEWSVVEASPSEQRGRAALDLYLQWGERDGEAAVLHAEAHGNSVASASVREAFRGWLSADPEGAREWVTGIPSGRRLLKMAGALGEALDSPAARAAWANDQADKKTSGQLLSRALAEWARAESAPDAVAWLENNGGLDSRSSEVGQLVRAWSDRDASAASKSVGSMPPGVGRDAAVAALVTVIAPEQAEAARTWAETIRDEHKRTELLALVAKIGGGGGQLP